MFFSAAMIVLFFLQPSTIALVLLGAGLAMLIRRHRSRVASSLAVTGFCYLVLCGLLPIGNAIILPLENRFAAVTPPKPGDRIAGINLLGGFEDGWVSAGRPGLAVNESAERLTEGIRLARRFPEARIVFTGGVKAWWPGDAGATGPIGRFLTDMGFDQKCLILEGVSRNTHENAVLTAELVKPAPGERWVLVTSAYHMPRAAGLFRKAGFDVWPYPVDYRTRGSGDVLRMFERIPAGLQRTDLAVNEWPPRVPANGPHR